MAAVIRLKGDRSRYDVRDRQCIGRECLNVHRVSVRGATASGSRLVGYRDCCARRDYHGCPQPLPSYERAIAAKRRKEGMRVEKS